MNMKCKRTAVTVFAMFFLLQLFSGVFNWVDIPVTALAREYENGEIIDISELEEGDYIHGDCMFHDGAGRTIYPICYIDGKARKLDTYADHEKEKIYKVFNTKDKSKDYIYTGIKIKDTSLTTYVWLNFKTATEDESLSGSMFSAGNGVWIILLGVVAATAFTVFIIMKKKNEKKENSSED